MSWCRYAVVGINHDLLTRIPLIAAASFVFVQSVDRRTCGIVTTADLSLEFATLAKPFFLLAEVECRLRRLTDRIYTAEEITAVVDPADSGRAASSADNLTMYFSPDPLDEDQIRKIERLLKRLRRLDPQPD
jgi:hypothetical protein